MLHPPCQAKGKLLPPALPGLQLALSLLHLHLLLLLLLPPPLLPLPPHRGAQKQSTALQSHLSPLIPPLHRQQLCLLHRQWCLQRLLRVSRQSPPPGVVVVVVVVGAVLLLGVPVWAWWTRPPHPSGHQRVVHPHRRPPPH